MTKRTRLLVIGAMAVIAVGAVAGIGIAAAGDDDQPLQGSARARAEQAALAETGGGEVIETEVGDDGAVYGVEVRLPDGTVVEVNLDEDFQVIGSETDDDGSEGTDDDDAAGSTEDD